MKRFLSLLLLSALCCACSISPATQSELAQGKRLFNEGYYKRAMTQLLPLAANGNAEAEYAVGYLYYYGYGTTQDIDTGNFWIKRAADQHFQPAIDALKLMNTSSSMVSTTPNT